MLVKTDQDIALKIMKLICEIKLNNTCLTEGSDITTNGGIAPTAATATQYINNNKNYTMFAKLFIICKQQKLVSIVRHTESHV